MPESGVVPEAGEGDSSGAGGVPGPVTGIRSIVPHGQPNSGRGHSPGRPQRPQRTVTHSSCQARWTTGVGAASGSSGGTTGAPHVHGYDGAV
ncbi:hypothetical protein AB0O86_06615 [Streptomyces hirsutus]